MQIKIHRNDILEDIYFITAITQKQKDSSMTGALSSRGDLMGGIFDRWINTVPEKIVLNKIILPQVNTSKHIEVISDFYLYDPKKTGIAPDVIGIKVEDKVIPFSIFNEKWIPVKDMPQIEVKSFKEKQYMVTLRDQSYKNKYLIMCETNFRIDYLLPFFDPAIFSRENMKFDFDDSIFIKSNKNNLIHKLKEVDNDSDQIGTVDLLKITKADSFMKFSTLCEEYVSVQYFKYIEEKSKVPGENLSIPLKHFCHETEINNIYKFNKNWYEGINSKNIPYYIKNSKGGKIRFLYWTLDFHIENIDAIKVIKKSVSTFYIETSASATINGYSLKPNTKYKVTLAFLNRSSNPGEEYFLNKPLVPYIPDFESELVNRLNKIIRE